MLKAARLRRREDECSPPMRSATHRFPTVSRPTNRYYGDDNFTETTHPAFVSVHLASSQVASDNGVFPMNESGENTVSTSAITDQGGPVEFKE